MVTMDMAARYKCRFVRSWYWRN